MIVPEIIQEMKKTNYKAKVHKRLEDAIRYMAKKGEEGPARLRGHIVNEHFIPGILSSWGVARFDIDLARALDIPLDWVVKRAYSRLEEGWPGFRFFDSEPAGRDVVYRRLGGPWNADWCKSMVVKNLRYIDQLGLGVVDWDRVETAFPGAQGIALDIERDSFDEFVEYEPGPIIPKLSMEPPTLLDEDYYLYHLPINSNYNKKLLFRKFI